MTTTLCKSKPNMLDMEGGGPLITVASSVATQNAKMQGRALPLHRLPVTLPYHCDSMAKSFLVCQNTSAEVTDTGIKDGV